jgi:hypothetical protein
MRNPVHQDQFPEKTSTRSFTKPVSERVPPPNVITEDEFRSRVALKAYELFEQRQRIDGSEVGDWLEAERLVTGAMLAQGESRSLE